MATSNGIFYSQTQGLKLSTNNLNRVIISTGGTTTFTGNTSGSTLIDVRGTQGQLLSVSDSLSGPLLSVNDISGNTTLQVNSNYSTIIGTPNTNSFVVSGTNVGIGGITSPSNKLHVSATTDPVRFVGLQTTTNTRYVVSDSTGVLSYRSDVLTTGSTINAATGGSYSNGTITLSGTGTLGTITGLTTTAATIYNTDSNLTSNRVVNLSSYTLNFSSSTNPNTLVLSGGSVGIGTTSPVYKLDVNGGSRFYGGTIAGAIFGLGTTINLASDAYMLATSTTGKNAGFTANRFSINEYAGFDLLTSGNTNTGWSIQMISNQNRLDFLDRASSSVRMTILSNGSVGIGTISPTNKLHISDSTNPLRLEGVQTTADIEVLTIDGTGVVHKKSLPSSFVTSITAGNGLSADTTTGDVTIVFTGTSGSFLRNKTHSGATDTIQINESIFNPADLTVLSTSVFIVDTDADYYILGDLYNYGSIIVNGTLKVGGIIYNYGSITGPGIIE